MAIRGRKPKPAHLKVLEGNPGKRPFQPDLAAGERPEGGIDPPRPLTRRPRQLWEAYIRPADWLTTFDAPRAFMWAHLQAEFEADPAAMTAARIAQLRALGSELGLDPSSRARAGFQLQRPWDAGAFAGLIGPIKRPWEPDPADEFPD